MSSFVIDKVEYIKAAGVVVGIIEQAYARIGLYDRKTHRMMKPNDIRDKFVHMFELNSANVYEYYSPRHADEELYVDDDAYDFEFDQYRNIGKLAVRNAEKLRRIFYNLHDFFGCALYQTAENDAYCDEMALFFNEVLVALIDIVYPHERECWGRFNAGK